MARADAVSSDLLPILARTIEAGEPLPSEEALAEVLGTSRPTIREALIRMEANGLVRRLHGSGTFPNPAATQVPIRLDQSTDFADRLAAVGFDASVEVLAAEVLPAGSPVPPRLDAQDDRVLRTVKRWRADGVVAVVAVDHVPLDRRVGNDAAVATASEPVLALAGAVGLGRADWMCTWPAAVELDDELAGLLELEPGRSVLRTEQLGVERHGRHVFHAVEHHRPDLVEYGLVRTVY
ncbi:MAG: GntR family transcriptional regulator [Actinomycetota bacterium]|nr:GntR family transcriptional regulator [Actinomycetota bacterium]